MDVYCKLILRDWGGCVLATRPCGPDGHGHGEWAWGMEVWLLGGEGVGGGVGVGVGVGGRSEFTCTYGRGRVLDSYSFTARFNSALLWRPLGSIREEAGIQRRKS